VQVNNLISFFDPLPDNKYMTLWLILFVVGMAVVTLVFIQASRKPPQKNLLDSQESSQSISYPYQKQPFLLTKAERSFFGVLHQAVENKYYVSSKVRLADILKTAPGLDGSKRQSAQNRINSKHVDFVLCDPNDLAICFVIELDDSSHEKMQRQERDDFVNKALEAAKIPIIHFPVRQAYNLNEIKQLIPTIVETSVQSKEAIGL
jgi:very-short-patch-repair endonuclease